MTALHNIAGRLARIEIWPVAFFIALSIAIPSLLPLALGVGLLFWLVRLIAYRRLTVRTPHDWSIALLLLMVLVTLAITTRLEITLLQSLRLISGILLFYAIANWAVSLRAIHLLVFGTALAGLTLSLAAPFSVQWSVAKLPIIPAELYDRTAQLFADAVHPNVLAGVLVLLLPLPLAWLLFNWGDTRWLERLFLGFSTIVILAVIVLTQSRGAWSALAAAMFGMLVLRWRWGWLAIIPLILLSVAALYRFGLNTILLAFLANPTLGDINGRVEIWYRSIYMIQDFPFTGVGMGSFQEVTGVLYPFSESLRSTIPHAHNLFFQVALDLGLPALVAWLAILILTVVLSWQLYTTGQRDRQAWLTALGAGLLLSQLALTIHGLTDAVTWGMVRPAPLVWGVWGLAVAARLLVFGQPETSRE